MSALPSDTERPPVGRLIYEIDLRPAMSAGELMALHKEAEAGGESLEEMTLRLLRVNMTREEPSTG